MKLRTQRLPLHSSLEIVFAIKMAFYGCLLRNLNFRGERESKDIWAAAEFDMSTEIMWEQTYKFMFLYISAVAAQDWYSWSCISLWETARQCLQIPCEEWNKLNKRKRERKKKKKKVQYGPSSNSPKSHSIPFQLSKKFAQPLGLYLFFMNMALLLPTSFKL